MTAATNNQLMSLIIGILLHPEDRAGCVNFLWLDIPPTLCRFFLVLTVLRTSAVAVSTAEWAKFTHFKDFHCSKSPKIILRIA